MGTGRHARLRGSDGIMRKRGTLLLAILLGVAPLAVQGAAPGTPQESVRIPFRIVLVQRASGGALQIREVLAFVPVLGSPQGKTVLLPLPPGTREVSGLRGLRPTGWTEGAVIYQIPEGPGPVETVLEYEVPYRWRKATLLYSVPYPTGSFDLFAPSTLNVESPQLRRGSPRVIRGERIQRFTAEQLDPGLKVTISLSGLPLPTGGLAVRGGILLMALAVAVALAAPWLRSKERGT